MADTTWTVPATVVRVIDGDTVIVEADLGWHVKLETAVRIDGINSPEKNTLAGKAAQAYAEKLLPAGTPVTIVSRRILGSFEKYGRVLADLIFSPPTSDRKVAGDFATAMLAAGHAKEWDGSGKRPV